MNDHASEWPPLLPQHLQLVQASGIAPAVARARGYRSVTKKAELLALGFGAAQARVPALLMPIWDARGERVLYQLRPDEPRILKGKAVKYETPGGAQMVLDVPPPARAWLPDPTRPLFVTEGVRKADAAVSHDLCCIDQLGVWNFRGTNAFGGKAALPDWERIPLNDRRVYLVFDSDVMEKAPVHAALTRLKSFLEHCAADVWVIYLPPGEGGTKVGLDDYFAVGHTIEELLARASRELRDLPGKDSSGASARVAGYFVNEDGCLSRERMTAQGLVVEPLCNFAATITEELILNDGVETSRVYSVEGRLGAGQTLPSIHVPVNEFNAMNWVLERWGVEAIVCAGITKRDCLREAIQRLSPTATRRHVYTHTEWHEHEGSMLYLMGNGAVGYEGISVDLGSELMRYQLPTVAIDPAEAMRSSLRLLRLAPLTVTAPLWAATFRAPLASAYPPDLSLWLEGQTGALNSRPWWCGISHVSLAVHSMPFSFSKNFKT